jgi:predicted nicotinamide N-methyase
VARYVLDHPREVIGKRVLDFGTGSGLCAIAAMRAGAASALAIDIDPLSEAAVALNAQANDVRIAFQGTDVLNDGPPAVDVMLAGDVCYERELAARILPWLQRARAHGTRVLIGDPDRLYFSRDVTVQTAVYHVPTTREIEGTEVKPTGVFTLSIPSPRYA